MSSREFDDTLGDLFRQALQPVASAHPPVSVWRRIVHDVKLMPDSIWTRLLVRVRGFGGPYFPVMSNLPVCVGPDGRCQPSPFNGVMARQGLEIRLAC